MRIHFDYNSAGSAMEGNSMTFTLDNYTPSELATRGWYLTNITSDGITATVTEGQLVLSGDSGATTGTYDADLFYYDKADSVPTTDMLFVTDDTTMTVHLSLQVTAAIGGNVYDNVMDKLDRIIDTIGTGTSNLATYTQAATIINRIG